MSALPYRCKACGTTFTPKKKSRSCPNCKSTNTAVSPVGRPAGAGVGGFFLVILLIGGVVVGLAYKGIIVIPGITPTPEPRVEKLEPPSKDAVAQPSAPPVAKRDKPADAPAPSARKSEAAAPAPKARALSPPIKPADVERARGLYAKGDFAGASRALEGCERAEVADQGVQDAALALARKARILDALTRKIAKNPLALASKLEQVSIDSGGTLLGKVTEDGDKVRILLPGGIETVVTKDQVVERQVVGRAALVEKLRARLRDREARSKPDAFDQYRLGNYCWQYSLIEDAVPYFDRAVNADDFPVVARVFGGAESDALVQGWCDLTGKPAPGAPPAKGEAVAARPPAAGGSGGEGPAPGAVRPTTPSPGPDPASSSGAVDQAQVAKARAKYEEGVSKYRTSFGDSKEADASLIAARKLFEEARDLLNKAGDDPSLDELRMQISRLLYDCSKRSHI